MAEKQETKPKDKKSANAASAEAESGFNLAEFSKGIREELGKVVWPSRQQLVSESISVILMVIAAATLIYLTDNLFSWIAGRIF